MTNESADVLVVGGGVVGVSTAYYLQEAGREVMLVEKGPLCAGASHGNAGMVCPSRCIPLPSPAALRIGLKAFANPESPLYIQPRLDWPLYAWLARFVLACRMKAVHSAMPVLRELHERSLALYECFLAMPEMEFDFQREGWLHAFMTRKAYKEELDEARLIESMGGQFTCYEGEALHAFEPALGPDVQYGIYFHDDAAINPGKFVRGLGNVLAQRGGSIRTHTEVNRIEPEGGRFRVDVQGEELRANQLVLASGAWTNSLLKPLGIELPLQPAKGYAVTVKRPAVCPLRPCLLQESKVVATPMGDSLRFAGTLEFSGVNNRFVLGRVEAIENAAKRYLPNMGTLEPIEVWNGLRPCSPDGLPYIGRINPCPNVVVATGHGMLGLSQGPITGKLVAQLICGESIEMPIGKLSPHRFSRR